MTEIKRPDTQAIISGLKDFQRDTVDYVFRRMYLDQNPTRRFLIADEVGLGKTMVARGLIAKMLDHLWESVGRIDVVYICSNGDIARQNVRKLNVTGQDDAAVASRITLLPTQIADLSKNHVNLVSFTPATSLDLKSSLGTAGERALLYWMLKREWGLKGAGPKNLLQGYAGLESFRERLKTFEDEAIDQTLLETFHRNLERHGEADRARGDVDIKTRFGALCEAFGRTRQNIPDEEWDAATAIIGELRAILAGTCVRALEPDLIILDEFQRFKELLEGNDDAGRLARELFEYSDEKSQARVLLLSATPYKMYTLSDEGSDDDHYADFLRTIRFLLAEEGPTTELDQLLGDYRRELFHLGSGDGNRLDALKGELEARLRMVMVRTERLAATENRDGMLVEVARPAAEVRPHDPLTYRALQQVASTVEQGDTIEYWKSAPYLLNFMDEYKLKEEFSGAVKEGRHLDVLVKALAAKHLLLPWQDIEAYHAVDQGNARLRWLHREMVESGAWRLLWVPPSLPYYKLGPPFDDPRLAGFTKRLIFSNWRVVPKVIAALLSYEAERRMMVSGATDGVVENTAEARKKRRGLLQFTRSEGRLVGMPVLGMLYPSIALARDFDPLLLMKEMGATPGAIDAASLMSETRKRLEERLGTYIARAKTSGAEDETWYWAAPILLDLDAQPEATRAWFGDPDLAAHWGADDEEAVADDESRSAWADHVTQAKFVASGVRNLGRPPADLTTVLAHIALAGPAVVLLRGLGRVAGGTVALLNPEVRHQAGRTAWALRGLFNIPEVMALLRGINGQEPYWQRVLEYCNAGCLQAVLDEYVHVVCDAQGLIGKPTEEIAETIATVLRDAIALRTALLTVEEIAVSLDVKTIKVTDHRMRARFAARLSEEQAEVGGEATRADQVRTAFNSPFWPFVLATTSVGQEGLDFHQYCHAVVHWNLPSNPVDLEQREGRVHRYKGHAVRKNLATKHAAAASASQADPWVGLFDAAVQGRPQTATDLEPFWVYATPGGARIERHVPAYPLSREIGQMDALRRSLAVYRMVFGQPRQEDLVGYLLKHVPAEELKKRMDSLRIDLSPPKHVRP